MVSTIENTLVETSPPTPPADILATKEQNPTSYETSLPTTRQQLIDFHRDYETYHEVLSREQIIDRYASAFGPLTFELGAQLLGRDSLEALNFDAPEPEMASRLHPPQLEDVELFGMSRDILLDVLKIQEQLFPETAKEVRGKTTLLNNILSQAIEEIQTDDIRIIRDMRCALDLAEEKKQSFSESLAEIRSGKTVRLSLEELDEAGSKDKEIAVRVEPLRTADIHFPIAYAERLRLQDTESITIGDAVKLAEEIAPTDPLIADMAFNGLSEGLTPKSPHTALVVADHISSPSLKAIRLSDILRTSSDRLEQGKVETTKQEINRLFDKVVTDQNPRQRVFAMAEIAANLDDAVTTRGVKQYIMYLAHDARGMTLNIPTEALFAAMDNTNTLNEETGLRRSFSRALANEMNKLHAQDDAERAAHQDEEIPPVPSERIAELAEARSRRKKLLQRRAGATFLGIFKPTR